MRFKLPRRHQPDPCNTGGQFAKQSAEQELQRVRAETPYFERLGRDLRTIRERNHFAESIRATFKGV